MRRREPWRVRDAQPGVGASGFAAVSVCLLGAMGAGCSSVVAPASEPGLQTDCVIATPSSAGVIDVAIARAVDPPHAPTARHAGERLVFRQIYDTLVRVDCTGALMAGVAESWGSEDGGRTWTFRLRSDARFWDGAPVTARTVIEGWAAASGAPSMAWVSAVGERELRVAMRAPVGDARVFSDPALAVVRHEGGEDWPVGTGAYRPAAGAADALRIVPAAPGTGGPPAIVFHVIDDGDPRRALDERVDVVVSGDAAVVEYARALAEYTVVPLPWTRTYVLAARAASAGERARVLPSEDVRAALARDAAPVGTRAATPPSGWPGGACERAASVPVSGASVASASRSLVHLRGDPVARGLAERIVALAWPFEQAPAWLRDALAPGAAQAGAPTTLALDEHALGESVRARRHLAYVVALPRGASACNGDSGALDDVARAALEGAAVAALRITPLVDARDHLIRHDSVGALTIDGDGTVRFGGTTP